MAFEDPQVYILPRPRSSRWPGLRALPRRRRASTGSWEIDDSAYSDHRARYQLLHSQRKIDHPIPLIKYDVAQVPKTLQDLNVDHDGHVARACSAHLKTFIRYPWPSLVSLRDEVTSDSPKRESPVDTAGSETTSTPRSSTVPPSPGPSPCPTGPIQRQDTPPASPRENQMPPMLNQYIPKTLLPDIVIAHRADSMVHLADRNRFISKYLESHPMKFTRRFPKIYHASPDGGAENAHTPSPARIATMDFFRTRKIGQGSHSWAYAVPIKFSHLVPLDSNAEGEATVVCKLANNDLTDRGQLVMESKIYQTFNRQLQEDVCTYNPVKPDVPPILLPAVVPKFYGYYAPVIDDVSLDSITEDEREDLKSALLSLSPLLLVEGCGRSIEDRGCYHSYEKNTISSLVLRLHAEKYLHHSLAERNVVGQPGPLSFPPNCRRTCTPSFRIIDFGRASTWQWERKEHMDPDALQDRILDLVACCLRRGIRDIALS